MERCRIYYLFLVLPVQKVMEPVSHSRSYSPWHRKKPFSQSFTSAPTHPKSTRTKEQSHRKDRAQHNGGDSLSLQALPRITSLNEADQQGLLPPGNHTRAHQQQADSGCLPWQEHRTPTQPLPDQGDVEGLP